MTRKLSGGLFVVAFSCAFINRHWVNADGRHRVHTLMVAGISAEQGAIKLQLLVVERVGAATD
jgi:hypothetical protein